MALATTVAVTHIPFGERPQYGQPYPEGIAVAVDDTADASGGDHTWTILADPGFLYRMELFNFTRGESGNRVIHVITAHRFFAEKDPGVNTSFDLNWFTSRRANTAFSVYDLAGGGDTGPVTKPPIEMISRLPMSGPLGAPGVATQLMHITLIGQSNLITNEIAVTWTYWRKQALYRPGFLSAFYEAPAVPPLIRLPT